MALTLTLILTLTLTGVGGLSGGHVRLDVAHGRGLRCTVWSSDGLGSYLAHAGEGQSHARAEGWSSPGMSDRTADMRCTVDLEGSARV